MSLNNTRNDHLSRRALLKGALVTAGGLAVPNWGGIVHANEVAARALALRESLGRHR